MTDEPQGTDCPVCKGGGYVHPRLPDGRTNWRELVPCKCVAEHVAKQKHLRLLELCELPKTSHMREMTFASFDPFPEVRPAYDAAIRFVEGDTEVRWLTLMGSNDTGKTHLAVAICKSWIGQERPARYAFVPLLLDELRQGYSNDSPVGNYEERFKFFCNVPLLVLDDLGAEHSTPWVQEKLDTIVDYRYINDLPLVVTTNKTMKQISVRIASRLQRAQGAHVIAMVGKEYRLRKKEGGKNA